MGFIAMLVYPTASWDPPDPSHLGRATTQAHTAVHLGIILSKLEEDQFGTRCVALTRLGVLMGFGWLGELQGKTMPFVPSMTRNGNHTTYKNGDLGDGWLFDPHYLNIFEYSKCDKDQ